MNPGDSPSGNGFIHPIPFWIFVCTALGLILLMVGQVSALNFSQTGGTNGLEGKAAVVNYLMSSNGTLYAATGNGVWTWDGSSWSEVGGSSGLTGYALVVNQLVSSNGLLYAATAGSGVWAWDGSLWSQVGGPQGLPGMSSSVNCLLIFKGTLYAGTWNDVWAWNGASWSLVDKVGSSPSTRTLYNVISLVDKDGTIYAGTDNGVWMWDDSSWETVGNTSLAVHDGSEISNLYVSDGTLYASTFGGVLSWDGTSWNKVGSFTGSIANPLTIFQLSSSQGNLYAGTTYGVYEWDGSSWSSISEFNGNKTIDPSILASSFGVNLTTAPTTFRNQTLISSILITPDGILYAGVAGGGVWAAPLQTLNQTAVNHEPISNNTTEPTTAEGTGAVPNQMTTATAAPVPLQIPLAGIGTVIVLSMIAKRRK